ncbi:MAG: hypothetical protein AAB421_01380 [Patescibacteria group bacterium]
MARKSRWQGGESVAQRAQAVTFNDALFNMIVGMVLLIALFMLMLNPKGAQSTNVAAPPGNIIIEAYWNQIDSRTKKPVDTDVDLWVKCVNDQPVGYSNKGTALCNYLRDDLGNRSPDDPVNYELTTSRGIAHGQYCVNVHLYSNRSNVYPITVKVTVKIAKSAPGASGGDKVASTPVLVSDVVLKRTGQELNVFCFTINEGGALVASQTFTSQGICLRSPANAATGKCDEGTAPFSQQQP